MKYLIAFFVAVLLPLQLSWGVAAAYCQHETTASAAQHFGHHSHVHDQGDEAPSLSSAKLMTDLDCGACHASSVAVLPAFEALPPAGAPTVTPASPSPQGASAPQRAPDRPQWLRLA
ncbi:cation efflux protein, CzcI family [Curvibacter microcysteis]|uniref:cation efflux protein, CzcI family n=1 Tax=Curvibacter microcysteis TaxID=3026419 RepID=UPI003906175B